MSKKCTPLWREAHVEVKMFKTPGGRATFGRSDVISQSGARDRAPCQKWAKREGFVACPKTMAGVWHLKRICKDKFSVAGAVQETCLSEMLGGQGADVLRAVAFWSIRSSVLGRWFCVTGAALRMTRYHFFVAGAVVRQVESKNRKTHWHEAVALNFQFLKEVSQNCFVFDVVKLSTLKKWRSLAELLRFWRCQVQNWGSLAELLRFWCCQVQKIRKSRRIASLSSLQQLQLQLQVPVHSTTASTNILRYITQH